MPPELLDVVRARLRAVAREWQPVPPQDRAADPGEPYARHLGDAGSAVDADPDADADADLTGRGAADGDDPREPAPRGVGPGALRALAVALVAAVALAGWWWWSGRPRQVVRPPELVAAGVPVAGLGDASTSVDAPAAVTAAGPGTAAGTATAGPVPAADGTVGAGGTVAVRAPSTGGPALVVVHVVGTVRRSGVVRLPAGSRVEDAVRAAGGLRPGAPLGPVNLARVLVDGEQVVIGPEATAAPPPVPVVGSPASGVAPGAASPSVPLDLNAATAADLEALPRVGPVLAERILAWRTEHGGFRSVQELAEVPGIGDATFAELAPLVRV